MRTWERVETAKMCGACGQTLAYGMLMQRIQVTGMKRRLIRCENCADCSAPDDVPLLPANYKHGDTTKRMKPIQDFTATFRLPHAND